MSLSAIILIVLILVLIGSLPTWPYSSGWGYYPSGGLGLVVLILVILLLLRVLCSARFFSKIMTAIILPQERLAVSKQNLDAQKLYLGAGTLAKKIRAG